MRRFFNPLTAGALIVALIAISAAVLFVRDGGKVDVVQQVSGTPASFKIAASGDFGVNNNTSATLTAIKNGNLSFTVALGDLSYGQLTPETAWCDYVKSILGSTYPFELVGGN